MGTPPHSRGLGRIPYTHFRDTGKLLAQAHAVTPSISTTGNAYVNRNAYERAIAAETSRLRAVEELGLRTPGRNVSGVVGVSNNNNNNNNGLEIVNETNHSNNDNNNGLEIVSVTNHSRSRQRSRKQRSRKQRSRKQRSHKQRSRKQRSR